ncbi:MAG: hypothetical protein LBJ00_16165 [Planctomycetaceae bacterium]|nr:hypothetical protein [Planctomycetaceae bacterium]
MFKGEAYRLADCGMFKVFLYFRCQGYTQAVLKFPKLDTQSRHREAVVRGRSLPLVPASVY